MRGHHRLCPLQMSESRQNDVGIDLTSVHERPLQFLKQSVQTRQRIADVQFEVGRNLIVATASRVKLASDVANPLNQRRFNMHMDVFESGVPATPFRLVRFPPR